jgi:hypothetical protein
LQKSGKGGGAGLPKQMGVSMRNGQAAAALFHLFYFYAILKKR